MMSDCHHVRLRPSHQCCAGSRMRGTPMLLAQDQSGQVLSGPWSRLTSLDQMELR
jgi:hypothetical protein